MFIFRLFGLTFLSDDVRKFKYLKIFRFVNLSWIVINLAIFVFLIISPSTQIFSRNYLRMSQIIEIANYIFALTANFVILIHSQMVRRKNEIWYEKLHQLDQHLIDKYRVEINHATLGWWNFWKVLITSIISVACFAINMKYALLDYNNFHPLLYVHNYFLKTIINLRYVQNLIRIDFIKHHILAFHDAIRKVGEHNIVEWKIVLVLDTHNRKHQNPVRKIDDSNDILMFKRFYATLFESMKLLENCFGWSLLAMISFTFIDLTSNLYWLIIALLKLDPKIHLIDCLFEIIPSVVTISCLIYSSFDASRKAKEVINSISKLYTNTTSCYNQLIKEFLMQVQHERIEMSANDFFIVDFQLFTAVSLHKKMKSTDLIIDCVAWSAQL